MSSQPVEGARRRLNPRQAETVAKVMDAADEELRSSGYDDLTIRLVAKRAGVSSATAYTYFASKNHLIAELFWRRLADLDAALPDGPVVDRLDASIGQMIDFLAAEPALTGAVTIALMDTDVDVQRLSARIGGVFTERFETALGNESSTEVLETIVLLFIGALVQAGAGFLTYPEVGQRLRTSVELVMKGTR